MNRMLSKFGSLFLVVAILAGCSDGASISIRTDSTGKKFDSTASDVWDSTKAGAKRLGEKVEELGNKMKDKVDNVDIHIGKKDSTKH